MRRITRTAIREEFRPATLSGNLYYVRLKTENGFFYKLGYTSLGSVKERFGYKGNSDEKYIDRELLFYYDENAFDLESELHELLSDRVAFRYPRSNMPLYGNGQSELYIEDVLGLDDEYFPEQSTLTRLLIDRPHPRAAISSAPKLPKTQDQQDIEEIAMLIWRAYDWLYKLASRIFSFLFAPIKRREISEEWRFKGRFGALLKERELRLQKIIARFPKKESRRESVVCSAIFGNASYLGSLAGEAENAASNSSSWLDGGQPQDPWLASVWSLVKEVHHRELEKIEKEQKRRIAMLTKPNRNLQ